MVKEAIETNEYGLATVGGVITKNRHLISAEFSSCIISICKCECNRVVLAVAALGCMQPAKWLL